jgi:uncharacterized membrane protein YccC
MVDSLHYVFLYGLLFVLIGAALTFFLGKITISKPVKDEEDKEAAA